jgi:hypothetical protein
MRCTLPSKLPSSFAALKQHSPTVLSPARQFPPDLLLEILFGI